MTTPTTKALAGAGVVAVLAWTAPALADDTPSFHGSRTVPVIKEAIRVTIDHRYAVTDLRQIMKNDTPAQAEGVYFLTTRPGAVATRFSYWNGEEEIKGELFEREPARQMYATVTRARRDPGILEGTLTGAFRYRIFPFAPDEMKRVEVRWESWMPSRGRVVEYKTPINGPRTGIVLEVTGAGNVESDTHEIEVERRLRGVVVRVGAQRGTGNDGFVLRYTLAGGAAAPFVHKAADGELFAVVDYAAPEGLLEHVKFDVDGASMVQLASPLPAVLTGERFHVAFRCRAGKTIQPRLSATLDGRPVVFTTTIDPATAADSPWVEHLWATSRVQTLAAFDSGSKEEIIEVALKHDITSPHTAFFAIPASETGRVAKQLADARRRKQWLTEEGDGPARSSEVALAPPAPEPARQERLALADSAPRHGGCAGCAVTRRGEGVGPAAALVAALALLFRLRRRRRA